MTEQVITLPLRWCIHATQAGSHARNSAARAMTQHHPPFSGASQSSFRLRNFLERTSGLLLLTMQQATHQQKSTQIHLHSDPAVQPCRVQKPCSITSTVVWQKGKKNRGLQKSKVCRSSPQLFTIKNGSRPCFKAYVRERSSLILPRIKL